MKIEFRLNLEIGKKWTAAIVSILCIVVDVTDITHFFLTIS